MQPDREETLLEELARLREEVVNTRNLTIKTDNHVTGLSAEVKSVSRALGQGERRNLLNSFVAYILFTVLIAGGLWLTFQARTARSSTRRSRSTSSASPSSTPSWAAGSRLSASCSSSSAW
jgi:hypothetical protein